MFFFETFWENIYNLFKSNNLEITLKLKHLIFGYKISYKKYYGANYFITILSFLIYKSTYLSEQTTTMYMLIKIVSTNSIKELMR
jgi:hypothetical protein